MKLSIITVNYNNKKGLLKTIESVISQTWREFEWILIDGGSSDGSTELANRFRKYFSYFVSESDSGVYNAMNKGIKHANGEFLIFMNSGDTFYEADTLRKVFYSNYQEDILYGDWLRVDEHSEVLDKYPPQVNFFALRKRNICHQAMFIRGTILRVKGYDESFKVLADWKRWTDAAISGASFKYLGIPICRYEANGISSNDGATKNEETTKILNSYPPLIMDMMHKIYYYENFHQISHLEALLSRGGVSAFITKVFMKVMTKMFL